MAGMHMASPPIFVCKMKVNVTYFDNDALSIEEIVRHAEATYGKTARVDVAPESTLAYDHIYFGAWQLLTHRQISAFFAKGDSYPMELQKLREEVLSKIAEIVDQVIIDNESKVT